jgi:hypothetical protein
MFPYSFLASTHSVDAAGRLWILSPLKSERFLSYSFRARNTGSTTITRAMTAVEARIGRPATDRDIAQELKLELREYQQMLTSTHGGRLLSLDALVDLPLLEAPPPRTESNLPPVFCDPVIPPGGTQSS